MRVNRANPSPAPLAGIIRVVLLVTVLAFAAVLLYVFPNAGTAIPYCLLLPGVLVLFYLFWFLHDWPRSQLRLSTFVVPLLVLVGMFALCSVGDRIVAIQEGQPRTQIANQLKQIALALHAYQDKHGTFPPAVVHAPDGTPLYSWRVLILPQLGEEALYGQFHLDEPWDSPHNKTLLGQVPPPYAPAQFTVAPDPSMTFYQVFAGPGTAFEGDRGTNLQADFPDGTAETILVVEAREAVPWTKPADVSFAPDQPLAPLGAPRRYRLGRLQYGSYPPSGFTAAMADGSIHFFKAEMSPRMLQGWITRNGGEQLGEE